jgi:acylphosphatase
MPDAYESVHVLISGKVQGVGYRAWLRRAARERGVSGWVRNLDGGEVEAVIGGEAGRVRELLSLCRGGPSWARVSEVRVLGDGEPVSGRFTARSTSR